MVEGYGQAQRPYSEKLENAKKQIDKFTPEQLEKYKLPNGRIEISLVDVCPPPEGYVKMNYWDNYFVNIPLGTIYRPKEPVNPLLWFGISGNASLQRKPDDNEKLMCEYVRLAIIHDYVLRYSGTPTDSYIFNDNYKGRWFQRDEFCKDVWAYYHYVNQSPDLIHMPATAQEKLSQLSRALKHVQADLSLKSVKAKTVYTGEEANKKLFEKIFEHGRPAIPDKPFISQSIKIVLDNNPLPRGYREVLTQEERAIFERVVPELSDLGLEAFLRREYKMGDERIKNLTWKQILVFCKDYIGSHQQSGETESNQQSGNVRKLSASEDELIKQHTGRDPASLPVGFKKILTEEIKILRLPLSTSMYPFKPVRPPAVASEYIQTGLGDYFLKDIDYAIIRFLFGITEAEKLKKSKLSDWLVNKCNVSHSELEKFPWSNFSEFSLSGIKAEYAQSDKQKKPAETEQAKKGGIEEMHDQVFICYSHKDKRWLEDLQTHLKPYVRNGLITAWSDKQIAPGSKWLEEIEAALTSTKVAVLLVTPNFLASDFIAEKELGPLLKKAEKGKVIIIWIPVRTSSYKETSLKDYQAAIDPGKPLANMKAERDKAWVRICEEIKKAAH